MENLISDALDTSMVVHRNLEVLAESNIKALCSRSRNKDYSCRSVVQKPDEILIRSRAGPLRLSGALRISAAIAESCEVCEQATKTEVGRRGSRQGRNWNTNQASDAGMT